MSTAIATKTVVTAFDPRVTIRLLEESYGPGAWHGPDLKAAVAGVSPQAAFWRPGPARHNIAEVAVHHAWCVRSVTAQLSGVAPEPFVLDGEDWFALSDDTRLGWAEITALLKDSQHGLAGLLADISAGRVQSPLSNAEQFDLVLGIACHAVYHAGQVQLIKALGAA
ncbi:MAG: DinB family protein [bacterium]